MEIELGEQTSGRNAEIGKLSDVVEEHFKSVQQTAKSIQELLHSTKNFKNSLNNIQSDVEIWREREIIQADKELDVFCLPYLSHRLRQ